MTEDAKPRRAATDLIVEVVHYAEADAGKWLMLPREFKTRENAASTASCIRRGFLRVKPQAGDKTITVGGKSYLALPALCEVRVEHDGKVWKLWLRVPALRRRVRVRVKARVG
jgi:hypothetical protein